MGLLFGSPPTVRLAAAADVDPSLPCEERRKTLQAHYGFECRCARCLGEARKELKQKMHQRDAYLQAQRR